MAQTKHEERSTKNEKVRCFIAVDPAPDVRKRIIELRRELEQIGADVRWARDEGLHCTLAFLGGVEEERLASVGAGLRQALADRAPFSMRALGVGAFPSASRPRVVWVGLESPELVQMAAAIGGALAPLGFAPEERAFRPHITLGRVRSSHGARELGEALRRRSQDDFGVTKVEAVVLYRSQLGPGGSRYTPLSIAPLG